MDEVLDQGTYHINGGVRMGAGTYSEIPSRASELLRSVQFEAEWNATTPLTAVIEVVFDYDEPRFVEHSFEGASPLRGSFSVDEPEGNYPPVVLLEAAENHTTVVGVNVAPVDQPVRVTIIETYAC